MAEMALAGEQHGGAVAVRSFDHLLIAGAAAWLHDRYGAARERRLKAVGEREEGIRSHHAAGDP